MKNENEDRQSEISVEGQQNAKPDDVRQFKRARSHAKGILSKRQNALTELMSDTNNLPELGKKLMDLEKALEKFQIAHKAFHSILRDEDDILESNDYYDTVMQGISDLKQRALDWKQRSIQFDIRPEDSVSNAGSPADSKVTKLSKGSKSSANSSADSSISASRARAAAKKAILEAQAASFARRQALQEEQLRLQQMTEELELQTEIAKANAEEQAYLEAEQVEKIASLSKNVEESVRLWWPNEIQLPVATGHSTQHDASLQRQMIINAKDASQKSLHENEQPTATERKIPSIDRKNDRRIPPTSTAGTSREVKANPRGFFTS